MLPYLGCAQATHQTAPSCLQKSRALSASGRTTIRAWGREERAALPLERFYQPLRLALDFEDLDGAVARAGGEFPAVVVEDCIVLFDVQVSELYVSATPMDRDQKGGGLIPRRRRTVWGRYRRGRGGAKRTIMSS